VSEMNSLHFISDTYLAVILSSHLVKKNLEIKFIKDRTLLGLTI